MADFSGEKIGGQRIKQRIARRKRGRTVWYDEIGEIGQKPVFGYFTGFADISGKKLGGQRIQQRIARRKRGPTVWYDEIGEIGQKPVFGCFTGFADIFGKNMAVHVFSRWLRVEWGV